MKQRLLNALLVVLKALIRIAYRQHVSVGEFQYVVEKAYVEVAEEQLVKEGIKPTHSQVAITTGLTRKQVANLRQVTQLDDLALTYNRGARLITGWLTDAFFHDQEGQPAVLSITEQEPSFKTLAMRYGNDMPYRALLNDLIRVQVVEILEDKQVKLIVSGYVPQQGFAEKIDIVGTDVSDLLHTLEHNLFNQSKSDAWFQRKLCYDNVPIETISTFKTLVERNGMDCLLNLNTWLAQQDRDTNPNIKGTGRMRVGVGIYYFENNQNDKSINTEHSNES